MRLSRLYPEIKHSILSEYIREPPLPSYEINRKISVTVAIAEHPTSTYLLRHIPHSNLHNKAMYQELMSMCTMQRRTYAQDPNSA